MKLSATDRAKTNPEHTAWTSKAAPRVMPSRACTFVATDGKVSSGVVVATTIKSRSFGARWAFSIARVAAFNARSEVSSPGSTIWRRLIPVLSVIQASDVSNRLARSSLVTTLAGRYAPQPTTTERIIFKRLPPGPHRHRSRVQGDCRIAPVKQKHRRDLPECVESCRSAPYRLQDRLRWRSQERRFLRDF